MDAHKDLDGAAKVLKENITRAKSYAGGNFSENAWQDYIIFCQNHEQLAQEFLAASDHLISVTDDQRKEDQLLS